MFIDILINDPGIWSHKNGGKFILKFNKYILDVFSGCTWQRWVSIISLTCRRGAVKKITVKIAVSKPWLLFFLPTRSPPDHDCSIQERCQSFITRAWGIIFLLSDIFGGANQSYVTALINYEIYQLSLAASLFHC